MKTAEEAAKEYAENQVVNIPKSYTRLKLYEDAFNAYIKGFESRQGEWISVADRLPEFGGRYLCCVMDINDLGTSRFVWNCAYHEVEKRFSDRYLTDGETITHWMELPALPPTETNS